MVWYLIVTIVGLLILKKIYVDTFRLSKRLFVLCLMLWFRYFLSAFHEFTFPTIVFGLSINAISSILTAGVGLLFCKKSFWLNRYFFTIYLFILVAFITAIYNGEIVGFATFFTKWIYFLVITILVAATLNDYGVEKVLRSILIPLYLPLVLLVLSVFLGITKATENDGSVSYIGGYNHEAVFSVIILTALAVIVLLKKTQYKNKNFMILFCIISLLLVNYRTTLIAALPLILLYYWISTLKRFERKSKVFAVFSLLLSTLIIGVIVSPFFIERFYDVYLVVTGVTELFTSDLYYTSFQKGLFSARIYIWSQYITSFFENSSMLTLLFGFGPDSWKLFFSLYAHNTFVSYLYEFGFFGLAIFSYFLIKGIIKSLKYRNKDFRSFLVVSHISFFILNLATMPLWQIEGVILFGILTGLTFYSTREICND